MPTHAGRWVCLLAGVTACTGRVIHASSSLLLIRLPLLQVTHQGFADDVLQAQVTGWVAEGVIPGVDAAYKAEKTIKHCEKRRHQPLGA